MTRPGRNPLLAALLGLDEPTRLAELRRLSEEERGELRHHWRVWARDQQLAPAGDWRTWLILAGRGFGKTRAGAEWVRAVAEADPEARIALVAASLGEARAVMVEGESGLVAIAPPRHVPLYEPSLRRLTWPNGAQATLYSAAEPETLRGPQHSHAWCDEVAKWDNASARATRAWDNLLLGLRLGEHPRAVASTTPRATPLVRRLVAGEEAGDVAVTRGATEDNRDNLPARFIKDMRHEYAGSPDSPRRSSTSTRPTPWPTPCSIARSRRWSTPRRPIRPKAPAGWSATPRREPGPASPVSSPVASSASGCSSRRATG